MAEKANQAESRNHIYSSPFGSFQRYSSISYLTLDLDSYPKVGSLPAVEKRPSAAFPSSFPVSSTGQACCSVRSSTPHS